MHPADQCILDHFVGVRDRTTELLLCIPPGLLEKTPEGETMSLKWHFVHIADSPDWWLTHALHDGGPRPWPPPYAQEGGSLAGGLVASRDRAVRFFTAEDGRRMSEVFSFDEGDGQLSRWTGRDRLLYLTEHEIHHRGRILLALLQWGIEDLPGEAYLWPATR